MTRRPPADAPSSRSRHRRRLTAPRGRAIAPTMAGITKLGMQCFYVLGSRVYPQPGISTRMQALVVPRV